MPNAKRLFGLQIDEVSSVDRDANGHALIAIAKRDREDPAVAIYDEDGNELDPAELQSHDVVYDENGTELEYLDAEAAEERARDFAEAQGIEIPDDVSALDVLEEYEFEPEGVEDDDRELAGVGKSAATAVTGGLRSLRETGRATANRALGQAKGFGPTMTRGGRRVARSPYARGAVLGAGGAAGGAGIVSHRRSNVGKSLGDQVLESLSKALNDDERDEVISKALGAFEARTRAAETRAARAENIAKSLADRAELDAYTELADEYGLPVDSEEFGEILAALPQVLSKRQLDTLDRVLCSVADANLYGEIGHTGQGAPSATMDQIAAAATEHIGKADITAEQATTALFAANPDMYEAYLSENGN